MASDAAAAYWRVLTGWPDSVLGIGRKPRLRASERICEMLEQIGVEDARVWANRGYRHCYRWEFRGTYQGVTCTGGSYDSMTSAAKSGMRLEWLVDWHDGELCAVEINDLHPFTKKVRK